MDPADIDAIEKATRTDSRALQRFKVRLLGELADSPHKNVRWHVAQLLPRLRLAEPQRRRRVAILKRWLDDDASAIVRVNALQALSDLANDEPKLRSEVERRISACLSDRSAAVRARARKLSNR